MKTLDHYNLIHNDIKPSNFLVKFSNFDMDLSHMQIVLTGFGLTGSNTKARTPIFSSPECFTNPDRKDKSSDIFSLGRVYLFTILPKKKFLKFLFVSLITDEKKEIMELIEEDPMLHLISKMTQIKNRIGIPNISDELQEVDQIRNWSSINEISKIIEMSTAEYRAQIVNHLRHFA